MDENNYSFKILLAEDNVLNRKVFVAILNKMGYTVDFVSNGHGVIEALRKKSYDIIFMDIYMPGMNGIEAARHIREFFPKEKQPFIIAMSAGAFQHDRDDCYGAGMNDYINKPVTKEKLYESLRKCITGITVDSTCIYEESEDGIFNEGEIMERLSGDKELILTIVRLFITSFPLKFDKLKESIEGNDLDNVTFIAHTIKGSARNVSAVRVASIASHIEEISKELNGEEIYSLLQKLHDSYYEFKEFVANRYEQRGHD